MLDQKKVWFVHNYTLNGNEVTRRLLAASEDHSWGFRLLANDKGDALNLLSGLPSKKNLGWQEYAVVRVSAENVVPSRRIEGTQVSVLPLENVSLEQDVYGFGLAFDKNSRDFSKNR